jgi:hypothetical protein
LSALGVPLVILVTQAGLRAGEYSLDLTAPGSFAGWAGNGTYADDVVPFSQGGIIETWLYPLTIAGGPYLRCIASSENDYVFYVTDAGRLHVNLELGPANWHDYGTPLPVVEFDEWQHVAVSYDTDVVRFFVNGVEVYSDTTIGGPIWGAHNIQWGSQNIGASQESFLMGMLDNSRVWSGSLSESEILEVMCEDIPTSSGLVASWRWEGTASDTVEGLVCPPKDGAAYGTDVPGCLHHWFNLGDGLAGQEGIPSLVADGDLTAGSPVQFVLAGALPFASCWLVVGSSNLSAPLKGGVLVPHPDLLFAQTVDFFGKASFAGLWPAGLPSGLTAYFQYWIADAAGPQGFAASNAVSGTAAP